MKYTRIKVNEGVHLVSDNIILLIWYYFDTAR